MTEHDRRALATKTHPVCNPAFAAAWGRAHPWCAACGAGEYGWHVLTNHHLIHGSRSDEPCNLLRLGWYPCHELAEGLDVRGPRKPIYEQRPGISIMESGDLLPKITLAIALSLKLRADPGEVDWARLEMLRGSRLPEPAEIPEFFQNLFRRNRPEFR